MTEFSCTRDRHISMRLTEAELEEIRARAANAGLTQGAYMRSQTFREDPLGLKPIGAFRQKALDSIMEADNGIRTLLGQTDRSHDRWRLRKRSTVAREEIVNFLAWQMEWLLYIRQYLMFALGPAGEMPPGPIRP